MHLDKNTMNQQTIAYYNERADEYDKVYQIPAEQQDLQSAVTFFQSLFAGKEVFEIACGTGYWTYHIAQTAQSVAATDISERMIAIARNRASSENVTFSMADMYSLTPEKQYDAVFGGFIWSHILLQELEGFLAQLCRFLKPGGILAFIDSHPVKNTAHDLRKIAQTDAFGNTFQSRTLDNGTTHLVLKNFPDQDFLVEKLSRVATDIKVVQLEHYWMVLCLQI